MNDEKTMKKENAKKDKGKENVFDNLPIVNKSNDKLGTKHSNIIYVPKTAYEWNLSTSAKSNDPRTSGNSPNILSSSDSLLTDTHVCDGNQVPNDVNTANLEISINPKINLIREGQSQLTKKYFSEDPEDDINLVFLKYWI